MSRFLFVVPPPAEQVRPVAAVCRELAWRGHDVAWTGTRHLLRTGPMPPDQPTGPPPVSAGLPSPTGLLELWNDHLLPLARDTLSAVHAAVEGSRPDALVVHEHAIAGAVVGHLAGVPWATVVSTTADLANPFWDLPGIARQVRHRVRSFLLDAGGATAAADCLEIFAEAPPTSWPSQRRHNRSLAPQRWPRTPRDRLGRARHRRRPILPAAIDPRSTSQPSLRSMDPCERPVEPQGGHACGSAQHSTASCNYQERGWTPSSSRAPVSSSDSDPVSDATNARAAAQPCPL